MGLSAHGCAEGGWGGKGGERQTTCWMLNQVCRHVKESVWTAFDTYGTGLQPAVFGDINRASVREVDLHFVTERKREWERERYSARGRAESWKDA